MAVARVVVERAVVTVAVAKVVEERAVVTEVAGTVEAVTVAAARAVVEPAVVTVAVAKVAVEWEAVTVAVAKGGAVLAEAMEEAATVAVVRVTCLNTSVRAAARGARLAANDFFFEVSSEAFVRHSHGWLGACQPPVARKLGKLLSRVAGSFMTVILRIKQRTTQSHSTNIKTRGARGGGPVSGAPRPRAGRHRG